MTCGNGHETAEGQLFCGECGSSTQSDVAICPNGHAAPRRQKFCGQCGAPAAPPLTDSSASPSGRWAVDPYHRHLYRYWDGSQWTAQIADVGSFGVDAPPTGNHSRAERWIGAVAGVVTVVLLAGAISAILTRYTPTTVPAAPTTAAGAGAPVAPPPAPPLAADPIPAPPPPPADPWPTAVIGAPCLPDSGNSTTVDGSIAYCVNIFTTQTYLWSLTPDQEVVAAQAAGDSDPSVGLCVAQTGRSAEDCAEYLARPSHPGDGATYPGGT